ncbi:unnamed protein product [Brachionus calyciflorus]|uniref:EF-hand domain-containing protein n=1 Tax=Brachionus calyciflorus TaxID=104777 RepID=A0A814B4D0_9BILA|nr:unnamed protein product [Brachionus calyciflorus]
MSYSYEESIVYDTFNLSADTNGSSRLINDLNNVSVSTYAAYTQSITATSTDATTNQIASDLLKMTTSFHIKSNNSYLSEIEQAILRSQEPIKIDENEEITVLGERGIWANKSEVINWKGIIPIGDYSINEDSNPEIITKRTNQSLTYLQELAIRYLRPPTPPAPGEIIIQQEANTLTQPAPPLILRQQPLRPSTPEPLVIREAPPKPPAQIGRKVITISGKRLPPPPRKVVIERLAPIPTKPQSVIIERWLPYSQVKRRVIYQRSNEQDAFIVKPRNVIIQWEAPQVYVKKDFKYLGIIRANPVEYVQRYGSTLKTSRELPDFVLDIKPPQGIVLAADFQYNNIHELEGEVQALRLVDLDREGLTQYKSQIEKFEFSKQYSNFSLNNLEITSNSVQKNFKTNILDIISDIFNQVDGDQNGSLSVEEAEKLLLKLNSRLGRSYGEDDVEKFFLSLDTNQDGSISLSEFRKAFENLI